MKGGLFAAGLLAASIGTSCAKPASPPKTNQQAVQQVRAKKPREYGGANGPLLKVLSKYGPWIENLIDLDYSDGSDKRTMIVYMGTPSREFFLGSTDELSRYYKGSQSFPLAYYNAGFNVMAIPQKKSLDQFDHELGHVLTMKKGERRLVMKLDGYSGPGNKELEEVTRKRIGIMKAGMIGQLISLVRNISGIDLIVKKWTLQINRYLHYRDSFMKPENSGAINSNQELKKVAKEFDEAFEQVLVSQMRVSAKANKALRFQEEKTEVERSASGTPQNVCRKDLEGPVEKAEALLKEFKELDEIHGHELDDILRLNKKAEALLGPLKGFPTFEQIEADVARKAENALRMDQQIFYSDQEAFARIFDSLMSTYVGIECINLFPLNEDELGLFEKMRYKDGPMLSNAVSKYRLALRMLGDGIGPEEIQAQLEYSEGYEYGGEEYTWAPYEAVIQGKVPVLENIGKEFIEERKGIVGKE